MKPWIGWSLLALFLAALLVVQFIPGQDADTVPATTQEGEAPA
jgi:hypothetical protein